MLCHALADHVQSNFWTHDTLKSLMTYGILTLLSTQRTIVPLHGMRVSRNIALQCMYSDSTSVNHACEESNDSITIWRCINVRRTPWERHEAYDMRHDVRVTLRGSDGENNPSGHKHNERAD